MAGIRKEADDQRALRSVGHHQEEGQEHHVQARGDEFERLTA